MATAAALEVVCGNMQLQELRRLREENARLRAALEHAEAAVLLDALKVAFRGLRLLEGAEDAPHLGAALLQGERAFADMPRRCRWAVQRFLRAAYASRGREAA
jgi:hypothetical protein